MKKRRKKYDREFKLSAVKLILIEGRSLTEVAEDLGVNPDTLRLWKREYEEKGDDAFPGVGKKVYPSVSDLEYMKLKKKNRQLEMELDILKKAMAISLREKE